MAQPEESFIRFACPRCLAKFKAPPEQAGTRHPCTRCHLLLEVPGETRLMMRDEDYTLQEEGAPSPPKVKIDPMEGTDEGYLLVERVEPDTSDPGPPIRPVHVSGKPRRRSALPRRPFLNGTFSFPFRLESLICTVTLSFGSAIALGLPLAICMTAVDEAAVIVRIIMALSGFSILFALWLMGASAYGLTILQETSRGTDTIEEWPHFSIFDWIADSLFIVSSLALSVFLTLPVGLLLSRLETAPVIQLSLAVMLVFPVALLSMLETNSPINPISLPVWRSLISVPRAWLQFYVLSIALAAITVALSMTSISLAGRTIGMIVTGFVVAVGWMIYFRLLGRLALYCSEHPAVEETEETEKEDEESGDEEELMLLEE
jgi:hypothetical protein